jgi:hypothetical protein
MDFPVAVCMKGGMMCATLVCTVWNLLWKRLQTSHMTDYTVNDCVKVWLYKNGRLKWLSGMWKRYMRKRYSERKIYRMKIHSISNQWDCSHF